MEAVRFAEYDSRMIDAELEERVRELRGRGLSPKEIARAIGVRPSAVADLIRAVAAERDASTSDAELARCWVSPGWSVGLSIDERCGWPDKTSVAAVGGLVTALVARGQRHRRSIEVCVFLVDVYCLGVKNALGPERMDDRELPGFIRQIFGGYESPPVPAPIDLIRAIVYGAVEYAQELGFDPHPDFARAQAQLGPASRAAPTSPIRFGLDGRPTFVQGPYDDPESVFRTLRRSVGADGFGFTVSVDLDDLQLAG